MSLSIAEIIAVSKERAADLRRVANSEWGVLGDAVRGFVPISKEWHEAVSIPFCIAPRDMATDKSAARVASLKALTGRIIEVADDIIRVIQAGSAKSALALWRTLAEAKNNALLIALDGSGTAGFLWFHLGVIDGPKSDPTSKELAWAAEQAKEYLTDAGYNFKKRNSWAIGIDGKIYANALRRSEYISRHRKLPYEIPRERYERLAAAEQAMIRKSNAVAHSTLFRGTVDAPIPVILLAAICRPDGGDACLQSGGERPAGMAAISNRRGTVHHIPVREPRSWYLEHRGSGMAAIANGESCRRQSNHEFLFQEIVLRV